MNYAPLYKITCNISMDRKWIEINEGRKTRTMIAQCMKVFRQTGPLSMVQVGPLSSSQGPVTFCYSSRRTQRAAFKTPQGLR